MYREIVLDHYDAHACVIIMLEVLHISDPFATHECYIIIIELLHFLNHFVTIV